MKYIDVKWIHANQEYPIRLVSELDDNAYEVRKLEFYSDGRIGYASGQAHIGDTRLSDEPILGVADVNVQGEFHCLEIDKESFERLLASSVPHTPFDNSQIRPIVFLDGDDVFAYHKATGCSIARASETLDAMESLLRERVLKAIQTPKRSKFLQDPIEKDLAILALIKDAENEAIELVEKDGRTGRGTCHLIWREQARILIERHDIIWFSPRQMNPSVLFD